MKGKAHSGDFQVQDVVKKKKKKKRKPNESNNNHKNAETVEDAEPGHTSPVLFEDPAAQGREKKKKLKRKAEKQQTLLDNYFVKVERGVSNGTAAAASPRKKKRRKGEDSSHELSCVPVSQEGAAACGYPKTHKKKRKEKQQPEEDEVGELPPPEEHKGHKEKAKKKRKKRREGTAEPLLPPSEQDRGWISPAAEDGACDAASGTSEVSLELPAGFSTPSKAAGRAAKAPKSSAYVVEESSSDSDVMTPKALGSREEQQKKAVQGRGGNKEKGAAVRARN